MTARQTAMKGRTRERRPTKNLPSPSPHHSHKHQGAAAFPISPIPCLRSLTLYQAPSGASLASPVTVELLEQRRVTEYVVLLLWLPHVHRGQGISGYTITHNKEASFRNVTPFHPTYCLTLGIPLAYPTLTTTPKDPRPPRHGA